MADIESLVAKYKSKLESDKETEQYKSEKIEPIALKVFHEQFADIFKHLCEELNNRLNAQIITFQFEGKNKFFIQGQYHRIYFQKNKVCLQNNVINVHIIPIYIWKGITKHLGPISFFVNQNNESTKWDIPFSSPEEYSKNIFSKLVDDEDFSM